MGVNEVSSRVAAFNAEIRTLAERGDGRDIMAWTGLQLPPRLFAKLKSPTVRPKRYM